MSEKRKPAGGKVIFASGNLISLDRTEKRFLDLSISYEGGQKSLKVGRVWDIRETMDLSVHLHLKWKDLGISSLYGLVHKLEIRLPEPKTVLAPGCAMI